MKTCPPEYFKALEREFAAETGYDPGEDRGYYIEWLVDRLWLATEGRDRKPEGA